MIRLREDVGHDSCEKRPRYLVPAAHDEPTLVSLRELEALKGDVHALQRHVLSLEAALNVLVGCDWREQLRAKDAPPATVSSDPNSSEDDADDDDDDGGDDDDDDAWSCEHVHERNGAGMFFTEASCTLGDGSESMAQDDWDKYFKSQSSHVEFLVSYQVIKGFIRPVLQALVQAVESHTILVPGCGNSTFSQDLLTEVGASQLRVASFDISQTVIKQMSSTYSDPRHEWFVADATNLARLRSEIGGASAIFDKSLIDCLTRCKDFSKAIPDTLRELGRCLVPGGILLFVTERGPSTMCAFLKQCSFEWVQCRVVLIRAKCDSKGQVSMHAAAYHRNQQEWTEVSSVAEWGCREFYLYSLHAPGAAVLHDAVLASVPWDPLTATPAHWLR